MRIATKAGTIASGAGAGDSADRAAGRACRILYIEANEDGTVGGSHQALFDLVRTLDRERYEPVVLFYQKNRYTERLRELGVATLDYEAVREVERTINQSGGRAAKLKQLISAIRRRRQFLREHRIDLVHINNSPRVGNDDWLPAARLLRIPCIANVMGDARGASGFISRWLFRQFDHYLPISAYIADAMEGHGIHRSRMDLIYLGVDIEAFRARIRRSAAEVRTELGIPADAMLAIMIGNIREWKGQHVVLDALTRLSPTVRSTIYVAFAGAATAADSEYLQRLRNTASAAGLEDRVLFLGPRQDVPELLNAGDIALHASIRPEPFGLVVIEAMAAAKPVLAANTGGPAEIVSDDSGVTFDPARPEQLSRLLERIVEDRAWLGSLAGGARGRAAQFTVASYSAGVQRVYDRIQTRRAAATSRRTLTH